MIRITDSAVQPFELEHIAAVREVAAECTVLLKNEGVLPLKSAGKIAIYGSGARKTIKGGTGSGDVNVRHFVTIEEGLENAGFTITSKAWLEGYDQIMAEARVSFINEVKEIAKQTGMNPVLIGMGKVMAEPEYELPIEAEGDTAIYVLARNSGEGADREPVPGDINLSQTEIRDILAVHKKYKNFILILNVGGMVNLAPVTEVKSVLLLSQLGTPTGDVLADLLLGKSYPSGKMAMTWAQIEEYPSTEFFGDLDDTHYKEGIYVGYRYFDTVGKTAIYPFGFGLGYTTFAVEAKAFAANEKEVSIMVSVTNTGNYAGKEVVQAYVSAPVGKLDKPYQELMGFVKTKELKPGETQEVNISFQTTSMASYDTDRASYVMEKGDYVIRVGNSSRDTKICGVITLDQDAVSEKLKNVCPGWGFDDQVFDRVSRNCDEDDVKKAAVQVALSATKIENKCAEYPEVPDILSHKGSVDWNEVIEGKKSLDEFVGSLTEEQLAYLSLGYYEDEAGMGSIIGSACVSIAGAAGETTGRLADLHVPTLTMADGPAGIRVSEQYKMVGGKPKAMTDPMVGLSDFMDEETLRQMADMMVQPSQEELDAPLNYIYCVAIPIGTALAQSWNLDAVKVCGDIVGKEMEVFGVNLWLAPAMNIQRSPLCGRNFEYYSEDPLLSGLVGAAMTNGVQSHRGCAATIKHFACNNKETNRFANNSIVSERALREIYLKTFEICVKASQPHAIMSSYNLVNGEHACNSKDILTHVLRNEWGYQGIVMTDWYVTQNLMANVSGRENKYPMGSAAGCVKAGNDISMPGGPTDFEDIMVALKDEKHAYHLTKAELQVSAKRVLEKILILNA